MTAKERNQSVSTMSRTPSRAESTLNTNAHAKQNTNTHSLPPYVQCSAYIHGLECWEEVWQLRCAAGHETAQAYDHVTLPSRARDQWGGESGGKEERGVRRGAVRHEGERIKTKKAGRGGEEHAAAAAAAAAQSAALAPPTRFSQSMESFERMR